VAKVSLPNGRGSVGGSDRGPDLAEYGASGTPIFGGFLREHGEYNPDLVGLRAISTYEQMRRSDAQVAATLMAIKLPIRSAVWEVTVDDEATGTEVEAAEFVRTCLFKDNDFTALLRNALLMLDFGVAAHENCWEIVGNRVHLAKAAARLPLTFYRWITSENGEDLVALEQLGWRGEQYVTTQVPADKLALFTYSQEGQNFTGISLLRAMYQHWYIKTQLYKVDAIACERNGMGVPVITMGTDAKTEDKSAALEWVASLVAHEKTGLVLPNGWLFALTGVSGNLRDPKESIAHHNTAISMVGLTMFMMLGQSQHGSHALGATMADFFFMGLEALSNQVARVLTQSTVKPLVDWNFAGVVNYPRVVCQQIATLKFETIVDSLQRLAASGIIEPDDGLESVMREKMGFPEVDKATVRGVPPVPPVTGGAPGKPADDEEVVDDGAAGGDAGVDTVAAMDVGSVHVDGEMTRKRPRGPRVGEKLLALEKHMALSDVLGALDKGRDDVAAALRSARPRIQAEVIHKLVDSSVRNMHRVSVAPDEKLTADVVAILTGVAEFGMAQVTAERGKQGVSTAAKIRMAAGRSKADPIGLFADGVVSEFQNGLQARATNVALHAQRLAAIGSKGELITAIGEDLDAQSDKWVDGVASKGANQSFAEGRDDGYAAYADEISSCIYSALLDLNTCGPCADADGAEGATPDDIPDAPNPDCEGGDLCRCVIVYVFGDEVANV
jgi:phage gp29-like protein